MKRKSNLIKFLLKLEVLSSYLACESVEFPSLLL